MNPTKFPHFPPVYRPHADKPVVQAKAQVQVPPVYRPSQAAAPVQAKPAPAVQPAVIQRRTTLSNGVSLQFETKGTPWSRANSVRSGLLSGVIDLYKNEILTFIAEEAKKTLVQNVPALRNAVPHVAVVIQGGACHIAINSLDFSGKFHRLSPLAIKRHLKEGAFSALAMLRMQFETMDNRYKRHPDRAANIPDRIRRREEGLFVGLRWAAKVSYVKVQDIEDKISGGVIHGEMSILNNEFDDPAEGFTPRSSMRVLRVGGTKTPCFDCAFSMDMHNLSDLSDATYLKYRQVNGGTRQAWTMSNTFGPGFPNWTDVRNHDVYRQARIAPKGEENFNASQDQNSDYLRRQLARVHRYFPHLAKERYKRHLIRVKMGVPLRPRA